MLRETMALQCFTVLYHPNICFPADFTTINFQTILRVHDYPKHRWLNTKTKEQFVDQLVRTSDPLPIQTLIAPQRLGPRAPKLLPLAL